MRILHIISSSGLYGAENVTLNLMKSLKENEHTPYLICIKNHSKFDPAVHFEAKKRNFDSEVVSCRWKIDINIIKKITKFVITNDIELIHSHGYKSNFYGLIASKLSNVPIIATLHLWTKETKTVRIYEWLDRLLIRKMAHIVSVSPLIYKEISQLEIPSNKSTLIPNGVDTDFFNPDRDGKNFRNELGLNDSLVVGTVGRLATQKGHTYLLQAFKEILNTNRKIKLLIVGDGFLKNTLQDEVRKIEIGQNVIFTGSKKDMVSVYNSIDIFVLPSVNEGLPMVLIEAMSMKLPVVASSVGAIPYVIRDKEGIKVSSKRKNELTKALLSLINNSSLREEMGEKARQRVVSNFSLATFYNNYEKVYRLCRLKKGSGEKI